MKKYTFWLEYSCDLIAENREKARKLMTQLISDSAKFNLESCEVAEERELEVVKIPANESKIISLIDGKYLSLVK